MSDWPCPGFHAKSQGLGAFSSREAQPPSPRGHTLASSQVVSQGDGPAASGPGTGCGLTSPSGRQSLRVVGGGGHVGASLRGDEMGDARGQIFLCSPYWTPGSRGGVGGPWPSALPERAAILRLQLLPSEALHGARSPRLLRLRNSQRSAPITQPVTPRHSSGSGWTQEGSGVPWGTAPTLRPPR